MYIHMYMICIYIYIHILRPPLESAETERISPTLGGSFEKLPGDHKRRDPNPNKTPYSKKTMLQT